MWPDCVRAQVCAYTKCTHAHERALSSLMICACEAGGALQTNGTGKILEHGQPAGGYEDHDSSANGRRGDAETTCTSHMMTSPAGKKPSAAAGYTCSFSPSEIGSQNPCDIRLVSFYRFHFIGFIL